MTLKYIFHPLERCKIKKGENVFPVVLYGNNSRVWMQASAL